MKANHLVLTTIYYPELLHAYRQQFAGAGVLGDVKVWVVGDRKTPAPVRELCAGLTGEGMETVYLGVEEQERFGSRVPALFERIPWNNEGRRNIGYLCALADGCRRLISIDDDNWPTTDPFLQGHAVTGGPWDGELVSEPSGFYNVCEHLRMEPPRSVFPRGFPLARRGEVNRPVCRLPGAPVRVGVTAGLWVNEPDIDAITWLNGKVSSVAYSGPEHFVLDDDTWSPINTQNTSVARDLIPAYLCVPMGWDVPGGKIQRYGDIWGGYFLQAVLRGTNWRVAFGRPLVDHRRNPHSYVEDLRQEFWGTILTDWLLQTLCERFTARSEGICDRVRELGEFLGGSAVDLMPAWCPEEMKTFMAHTAGNLREWAEACRVLMRP